MRLDLGAPLLKHLQEILPTLPIVQHTFALLLLHHNAGPLAAEQMASLIDGVLGEGHWLDIPSPDERETGGSISILRDVGAIPRLLDVLDSDYGSRGKAAASALLDYHQTRLTTLQKARAWALAFPHAADIPMERSANVLRVYMEGSDFRAAFEEAVADVRNRAHDEPGSSILARSFKDPEAWRDILWQLLLAGTTSLEIASAEPLFVAAEADPAVAAVIGRAARDFLKQMNDQEDRRVRGILTILAHEYGGLPSTELAQGFNSWQEEAVQAALVARGASIPEHFTSRDRRDLLFFAPLPSPPSLISAQETLELTRDTEQGPLDVLGFLGRVLLQGGLNTAELTALAEHSRTGALAAAALEVCEGRIPRPRWVVRALGAPTSYNQGKESDVGRIRNTLRNILLHDSEFRAQYVVELEKDLQAGIVSEGRSSHSGDVIRELLAVRGELTLSEWQTLIEAMGANPHYLHTTIASQIADALAKTGVSGAAVLVPALRRAGTALQSSNTAGRYGIEDSLVLLTVALALLWLEDEVSTMAERLFLLALPTLLLKGDPWHRNRRDRSDGPELRGGEAISSLWPLLSLVPASRLQKCMAAGLRSDVPEVRACCRLLAAIAATPSPPQTTAG